MERLHQVWLEGLRDRDSPRFVACVIVRISADCEGVIVFVRIQGKNALSQVFGFCILDKFLVKLGFLGVCRRCCSS
jgi:hypothetical protein